MKNLFNKFDNYVFDKTLSLPFDVSLWGNDVLDALIVNDDFFKYASSLWNEETNHTWGELIIIVGFVNQNQMCKLKEHYNQIQGHRMVVKIEGSLPQKLITKNKENYIHEDELIKVDLHYNKFPLELDSLIKLIMKTWNLKYAN